MRQLLGLAIALITLTGTACAAEPGWHMQQKSIWGGQHAMYVSQEGMKFHNPQMGVTAVSSSPNWRMVVFNDKTKCYFIPSVTDKDLAKRMSMSPLKKTGIAGMIAGQPVEKYLTGVGKSQQEQSEMWIATKISLPITFNHFLSKMYKVPNLPGIPLRITYLDRSGKPITALDTMACQQGTIAANFFTYPTEYKRVDDEVMVLMGSENNQEVSELLNEFKAEPGLGRAGAGRSNQALSNQAQQELKSVLGGQQISPSAKQAVNGYLGNKTLPPKTQQTINNVLSGQGLSPQQQQQLNQLLNMYGKR